MSGRRWCGYILVLIWATLSLSGCMFMRLKEDLKQVEAKDALHSVEEGLLRAVVDPHRAIALHVAVPTDGTRACAGFPDAAAQQ